MNATLWLSDSFEVEELEDYLRYDFVVVPVMVCAGARDPEWEAAY